MHEATENVKGKPKWQDLRAKSGQKEDRRDENSLSQKSMHIITMSLHLDTDDAVSNLYERQMLNSPFLSLLRKIIKLLYIYIFLKLF